MADAPVATAIARARGSTRRQNTGSTMPPTRGQPGLLGALTSRGEAHVMRLAAIYAVLDQSDEICVDHLQAAYAVWQYCADTCRYVFGDRLGDETADSILSALERAEDGLTKTDLFNVFHRNRPKSEIDRALNLVIELGRVRVENLQLDGRTQTVFKKVRITNSTN